MLVAILLSQANFSRRETVRGWLEPAAGLVQVYPQSEGRLAQLLVTEGEQVVQNQPLAIINGDHILADGQHLETLLLVEYQQQKQALLRQLQRGGHITDAELELLQEQQLSLKQKIQQLSLLRLRQQANIAQLQVHKKQQPIEAANQADSLHITLSDLSQQIARLRGDRAYVIKASISLEKSVKLTPEGVKM